MTRLALASASPESAREGDSQIRASGPGDSPEWLGRSAHRRTPSVHVVHDPLFGLASRPKNAKTGGSASCPWVSVSLGRPTGGNPESIEFLAQDRGSTGSRYPAPGGSSACRAPHVFAE